MSSSFKKHVFLIGKQIRAPLLVVVIYALMLLPQIWLVGGEPWGLIGFTSKLLLPEHPVPSLYVLDDTGYDGQFYYAIALTPWLSDPTELGFRLDKPAYRKQRILYPAAIYLIGHGDPIRTAWAMFVLNLLILALVFIFAARLLSQIGIDKRWAWLVALYPGFVVSVSRGLAEPPAQ